MGLLDRINKNKPDSITEGQPPEKPSAPESRSMMSAEREAQLRTHGHGIPPVKPPQLPPRRAATLIACTKTRRVYWVVFQRAKNRQEGWRWETNLPAIPDYNTGLSVNALSSNGTLDPQQELPVGGRDWEDWSCPGCDQAQIKQGPGDFLHRHICRCNMGCCCGPGADEDRVPTCPNCGKEIMWGGRLTTTLANTQHAKGSSSPNTRKLPSNNRHELEGN